MNSSAEKVAVLPQWQLVLGGAVFVIGQLSPLLIPFVTSSDLSDGTKSALTGLLLLGVPELAIVASIAILGKPGFNWLRDTLFGLLKRAAPVDHVSKGRYRLGLICLCIPLLAGWLSPYVADVFRNYSAYRLVVAITGDGMLVIGLFLLGGNFWEKLRALFVHEARAVFPEGQANCDKSV